MTRKVHIAVMAYDGNTPVPLNAALQGAIMQMTSQKGWNVSVNFRQGDSILPRARNAEVANFMHDPEATDLLMIDADTYCPPEGMVKLIAAEVDIVGAPYRTRNDPLTWASVRWLHQDVALAGNGLLEVEAIGTGLIRVSKTAMAALYAAEPKSYIDPTCKPGKAKPVFWFEVAGTVNGDETVGHLWGEDITFCRKWRNLGGKVWTDPSITTGHRGCKDYSANLAEWLSEQPGEIKIDDVIGLQTMVKNGFVKKAGDLPPPPGLFLPQVKSEAA